MANYAVFLRGVNVGGVNIKMADLRRALEELPLSNVKTLLASGNVVCSTALTTAELKQSIEDVLRRTFGYVAWVVVIEGRRLRTLVDACPFPSDDAETHAYITLFSEPSALNALVDAAAGTGAEPTVLGPDAAAWKAPRGGTLDSPINKLTGRRPFKDATTTRNLRTLRKVLDALPD